MPNLKEVLANHSILGTLALLEEITEETVTDILIRRAWDKDDVHHWEEIHKIVHDARIKVEEVLQ